MAELYLTGVLGESPALEERCPVKLKWSGKRTVIAVALLAGVGLLYVQGADQRREQSQDGAPTSSTTSQCRVASTVDGLRVRSAPAVAEDNVVDELAAGEESDADKVVQNGFRKLGEGRWVSADLARPLEGRDCG
ncbi:MAG: SH3 domain-containing protein [Pseudonocardiaceae bacterium]|nr:SH3 domain-containing protein [Pseudonocardiaceae bacterium]